MFLTKTDTKNVPVHPLEKTKIYILMTTKTILKNYKPTKTQTTTTTEEKEPVIPTQMTTIQYDYYCSQYGQIYIDLILNKAHKQGEKTYTNLTF
jgi:hypothetical protein